ncbi:MAG TPA: branched-chain amino acid ABC transporter permease [Candidatus Cybelea sp.]|nr:branched-chain amino acid ABC transporter permease [Candidatus Cybelea sp.]
MTRRSLILVALVAVALAGLPLVADDFALHVATTCLYYTILAASWNLLAGFTGQFSLAHQAFAAIGAYTSGLLIHYFVVPIPVGIVAGIAMSALLGLALGRIVLRMRAIYLAIATWAFAETFHILLAAAYTVTRGELGLNVPPLFHNLDPRSYYWLFAFITLASVLVMWAIVRSPLGYFMRAIKDDELRAETLGVDTTRAKVLVFTISSAFAGMAGAFYGHYLVVLSPQMADFNEMAKIIVMAVVGGLGSFAGPLVGAAPVQVLATYLQKYGEWDMVIYAVVVIALMRTHMGGIVSLTRSVYRAVASRSSVRQ